MDQHPGHYHLYTEMQRKSAAPPRLTYRHPEPDGQYASFNILPCAHSPMFRAGQELLKDRPAIMLGISPGNGFFTRQHIEIALCAFAHLLHDVTVVIPDVIAVHTFLAMGYTEKQSLEKARHNGRNLRNRCQHAFEKAQASFPDARLQWPDWERDISVLPGYEENYAQLTDLFECNASFRQEILRLGESVLASKSGDRIITEPAAREASQYLLKELAYLMMSRRVFGRDLVIAYHQDFYLLDLLLEYGFTEQLAGVGAIRYTIELPEAPPALALPESGLISNRA